MKSSFLVLVMIVVLKAVHAPGLGAQTPVWRVEPVFTIERPNGADSFWESVTAVVANDDRFIALDGTGLRLYAFDVAGRPLWAAGREGSGPFELLRAPSLVQLPDGQLAIPDYGNGRWTVFTGDGKGASTYRMSPRGGGLQDVVTVGDRIVYVIRPLAQEGLPAGSIAAGGAVISEVLGGAVDTIQVNRDQPFGFSMGPARSQRVFRPDPRRTGLASDGRRLYVATSDQFPIRILDGAGKVLGAIQHAVDPRPFTREERQADEASVEQLVAGRGYAVTVEFPAAHNPIGRMVAGDDVLLVRMGDIPAGNGQPTWWVFESGTYRGSLLLPASFEPLAVRQMKVYGASKDALGVPSLSVFALIRPR